MNANGIPNPFVHQIIVADFNCFRDAPVHAKESSSATEATTKPHGLDHIRSKTHRFARSAADEACINPDGMSGQKDMFGTQCGENHGLVETHVDGGGAQC